jgi:hypothetical protein
MVVIELLRGAHRQQASAYQRKPPRQNMAPPSVAGHCDVSATQHPLSLRFFREITGAVSSQPRKMDLASMF